MNLQIPDRLFRNLIESSGLSVWIKDLDSRYCWASKQFYSDLDKQSEEVIGAKDPKLFPLNKAADIMRTDKIVVETREPMVIEIDRANRTRARDALIHKFPVFDDHGEMKAIAGVLSDVEEISTMKRHLHDRLGLMDNLLNAIKHGVLQLTPIPGNRKGMDEFQLLVANQAACDVVGLERSEVIGQRLSGAFLSVLGGSAQLTERCRRLQSEGGEEVYKSSLRDANGQTRHFEVNLTYLDRDLVATIVDVTKSIKDNARLERLNRELEQERTRYRNLYRKTPVMMHCQTKERIITEVSDRWLAKLGYSREEVIGQHSRKFIHPETQKLVESEYIEDFWRDGEAQDVAFSYVAKDGRTVETDASAIIIEGQQGLESLSVLVDVTERNRALADLETQAEELQRANEELRQFTYFASHDLQEPMRKVQVYSDLLQVSLDENDGEEVTKCVSVICGAAKRGNILISALLAYSRAGYRELDLQPVDLREAVNETVNDLSHLILETGLEITCDLQPVALKADDVQLRQLLGNLISNAIKYRTTDGPAKLTIRLEIEADGANCRLIVEDNGIGFDMQYVDHIFEPFKRLHTRSDYLGTGVGLALCQRIAERHGWKIEATGVESVGSKFVVTFQHGPVLPGSAWMHQATTH